MAAATDPGVTDMDEAKDCAAVPLARTCCESIFVASAPIRDVSISEEMGSCPASCAARLGEIVREDV